MSSPRRRPWILLTLALVALVLVGLQVSRDMAPGAPAPETQEGPGGTAPRSTARAPLPARSPADPRGSASDPATHAAPQPPPTPELLALASQLDADPRVVLACDVDPIVPRADAYLLPEGTGPFGGQPVFVVNGRAYLSGTLLAEGAGVLSVEGFTPTPVRWQLADGDGVSTCTPDPLRLRTTGTILTGTVRHAESQAPVEGAWVAGCGALGRADQDGVYFMEVLSEPCTLHVSPPGRPQPGTGGAVDVTPTAGQDLVVDLLLP